MEYSLIEQPVQKIVSARLNLLGIADVIKQRRNHRDELAMLERSLIMVCDKFDYQIRDIQQLIARLNLVLRAFGTSNSFVAVIVPLLLVLRQENYSLYRNYVQGELVANEVIEFLLGISPKSTHIPDESGFLSGWIIRGLHEPGGNKTLEKIVSPWESLLEKLPKGSNEYYEVDKLIKVASSDGSVLNGHWLHQRISKSCFEAIEFINEIRI